MKIAALAIKLVVNVMYSVRWADKANDEDSQGRHRPHWNKPRKEKVF